MPFFLGQVVFVQAGYPFSEVNCSWHHPFTLPLRVSTPSKNNMRELLENGDIDCWLSVQPDKYLLDSDSGGWTRVILFTPIKASDQNYATLGGNILDRIFSFQKSTEPLLRYWCISQKEAQILLERLKNGQQIIRHPS